MSIPDEQHRLAYDCLRKPQEDISSTEGFLLAVQKVLRIRKGGLLWLGVPCSGFCWMAKSRHGRCPETPLGNEEYESVQKSNLIATRSVLLLLLAAARGVFWFVEQPSLSTLEHFPYLVYAMRLKTLNCQLLESNTVRWLLV